MPGKMFEIEPEKLCEKEIESCTIWYDLNDVRLWGDMYRLLLQCADQTDFNNVVTIADMVRDRYGLVDLFSEKDWQGILEDAVERGWGVYDSDTRLLLWSPERMVGRPREDEDDEEEEEPTPGPIRKDNVSFVKELMEFSPAGGMAQLVIIEAIGRYVNEVSDTDLEAFVQKWSMPMFNPVAWHLACQHIKSKLDAR